MAGSLHAQHVAARRSLRERWRGLPRWGRRLILTVTVLVVLGISAIIALGLYYASLINTYTATQPAPMPEVSFSPAKVDALKHRWINFVQAIQMGQRPEPFRLTAEDINQLIAGWPGASNMVHVRIEGERIKVQFSVPLDQSGKKELMGRFLNGVATLRLEFQDQWLSGFVEDIEANGQPIPRWLLKQVQKRNVLAELDKNMEFTQLCENLESIEVRDGAIVLTPVEHPVSMY